MLYAFGFLIVALLVKDTAPIGDQYVLRSVSQGLCFAVGIWWLFTQGSIEAIRRYWLVAAYIGVLCGTAFVSSDPARVLLQVLSFFAVTLFFIGFCEQGWRTPEVHATAVRIVIYSLLPICVGSLLLFKIKPSLAYDQTVEQLAWDSVHRFKGLFGKPSGIATASGILFGLCVFTKVHWFIRGIGALSSILCLYLTLSRSFWVGAVIALIVTLFLYIKRKDLLIMAGIGGVLFIAVMLTIADTKISGLNQSKELRSDSLENMSGRTTIWTTAIARFWDRPLLGYGYTVGHHAFFYSQRGKATDSGIGNITLSRNETLSMHNGYVQALVDSGAVGTLFYVSIMGFTVWRIMRYDRLKSNAPALYCLVFLSIANMGETVVYVPASAMPALYWYAAILALGLRSSAAPGLEPPRTTELRAEPVRTSRYPILSYPTT